MKEENLEVSRERCWKSVRGGLEVTGMGRYHFKKHIFFWALPEKGGRVYPCPNFWPFFHKVIGPEISLSLLKSHNICVFLCNFYHKFHQYYHHHHHNYHFNHHHHHLYFFSVIRTKRCPNLQTMQVAPSGGQIYKQCK